MAKQRKKTSKHIPAKGRLRDFADQLWSYAVRDEWRWRCAVCGGKPTEAHHLIPRHHELMRYSSRNGIALCFTHHKGCPDISPHLNAAGWMAWLFDHQPDLHEWYTTTVESGDHRRFDETKNAAYYINLIEHFRRYVPEDEFIKIVGVRFAKHLAGEREGSGRD